MHQTESVPFLRGGARRGRRAAAMAKKRRVKGATAQRKITLPSHVWTLLDDAASLFTDAYKANNGATKFTVSDAIESGVEMFLLSLREDLGPIPTDETSRGERQAWVAKLAEKIRADILEEFWSKKSH